MNPSPHSFAPGKLVARVEDALFMVTLVAVGYIVTIGYLYLGALLEQAI